MLPFYGSLIITRMIYIALLWASMLVRTHRYERLKMTFESGFTSVTTHINSGNIVFEHVDGAALQTHVRKTGDVAEEQRAKEDKADLTSLIEQAIKEIFSWRLKLWLSVINELDEICQNCPSHGEDKVVTDPKDIDLKAIHNRRW